MCKITIFIKIESEKNEMRDCFIGSDLSNKLKTDLLPLPTTISPVTVKSKSFFLLKTSEEELGRLILNLKTDCGAGWDGITPKILKCLKEFIITPLNHSFNRHIISGCSQLSNGDYLHRHNQVARIIHQQLAIKFGFTQQDVPYYKYEPKPVLENRSVTLYWDRSIITDRFIVANKPDIVVIDRTARKAIIVDISVPHDENLVKAENDKKIKYIDLAHEIVAMWDVDSTIIVPIVVSVNGLIGKTMDDYLSKLGLGKWLKGLIQKSALLNTARIVRRFLSLDA
ncbi:unnamed protein product [Parnassius mnemosyne]|uniref:Reverse transcriptase n=1 Tax=Parnassius mnemosyne TaxID=213953 RepID=A0AAV1KGH5_9NEOP